MLKVYNENKFIASFENLKDARAFVTSILFSDYSRKGYSLVSINFPRRGKPYIYTFGKKGFYKTVYIYRFL